MGHDTLGRVVIWFGPPGERQKMVENGCKTANVPAWLNDEVGGWRRGRRAARSQKVEARTSKIPRLELVEWPFEGSLGGRESAGHRALRREIVVSPH